MTLGKRISVLRKDKKLSQEYVAETLHVSRQAVSKWENDLSSPDTDNLIALAQLLETDVEFLATGEITEEMESDPIPEEPSSRRREKVPKDRKRLLCVFLAASVFLNVLLFALWRYEAREEALLEKYCASGAANASTHFADYVHHNSDGAYWQGVASFYSFMTSYYTLYQEEAGASYNFEQCNILLTNMLYNKDRCSEYMEQIRRITRLLGEDPSDVNTYHDLSVLNNEIRYGD